VTEYLWVQSNNSEYKHMHQSEDNEEQVKSRWGVPVEEKTREIERGNVTNN
jgi:hypothetical protein